MPCADNGQREHTYTNNTKDIHVLSEMNVLLNRQLTFLEAGLCAVIIELEKRGIAIEVISEASKRGMVDLMSFWEKHSKEDEARLANKFHSFSEHEQAMMRKMIRMGKM
jgi:hypothetical protein